MNEGASTVASATKIGSTHHRPCTPLSNVVSAAKTNIPGALFSASRFKAPNSAAATRTNEQAAATYNHALITNGNNIIVMPRELTMAAIITAALIIAGWINLLYLLINQLDCGRIVVCGEWRASARSRCTRTHSHSFIPFLSNISTKIVLFNVQNQSHLPFGITNHTHRKGTKTSFLRDDVTRFISRLSLNRYFVTRECENIGI